MSKCFEDEGPVTATADLIEMSRSTGRTIVARYVLGRAVQLATRCHCDVTELAPGRYLYLGPDWSVELVDARRWARRRQEDA